MDVSRILRSLLAVLVTVGLTVAPLAPVMARTHASDAGMQMMDMPCDMPCCPDKDKQGGCQNCPFLAICMLKVLRDGPSTTSLPIRAASSQTLRPMDEPEITGLTRPPPHQPPRMIV